MTEEILKTPYKLKCEARDEKVAKRYFELIGNPKNAKMAVLHKVMDEFDIAAESTIYANCVRFLDKSDSYDKSIYGYCISFLDRCDSSECKSIYDACKRYIARKEAQDE